MVQIQGHRGARGSWPENTLPSLMATVEAGVPTIEIDLVPTRDGEIIIHHDFFVNPDLCTYLDGSLIAEPLLIPQLTYSEIKNIDCGANSHSDFPKQKKLPGTLIPSLKEFFIALTESTHPHAKSVRLNLDIKTDSAHPDYVGDPTKLIKEIIRLVGQFGFSERVYYSSFDPHLLSVIRKMDSKAALGFLCNAGTLVHAHVYLPEWIDYVIKVAKELQAKIVSPEYLLLNETNIHRLQAAGFEVITWTVNDYGICEELIRIGIDGIITDYPIELLHLLKY